VPGTFEKSDLFIEGAMRKRSLLICFVASVIAVSAADSFSQTRRPGVGGSGSEATSPVPGASSISGRVVLPSGNPVSERVRITLSTSRDPGTTVYTDTNGAFNFYSLREGNYSLEAAGDSKVYEATYEQVRLARGARVELVIHLREKAQPEGTGPVGDVVSASEIDKGIPQPALTEFKLAHKLLREGKQQEAIDRFKRAIEIYPEYLMARNDLAVQYLNLKWFREATEQLEAAIEVAPKAFNPRLNLGIALLAQKRFSEAIDHLRQAVATDSSRAAGHMYLGVALLETDELESATGELAKAFSIGGDEYSVVHFYQARLHLKRGDRESAIRELQSYLAKAPDGEYAAVARSLLARL
jgi:tetratricopeptide (TPR) repeat protein